MSEPTPSLCATPPWEGIIPYKYTMVKRARELRNKSTASEIVLWKKLKNGQLLGFDFDRQRPLLGFIVDFYCKSLQLAIEIDGDSHKDKAEYDRDRENLIKRYGVSFLRFSVKEVENNLEDVIQAIKSWIQTHHNHREGF